jgi:catechol 2,3-dioxygenase-like lactoylglutathione lyase family enzyme
MTVIDCPDPRALAEFYCQVLGMRVNEDIDTRGCHAPSRPFRDCEGYAQLSLKKYGRAERTRLIVVVARHAGRPAAQGLIERQPDPREGMK